METLKLEPANRPRHEIAADLAAASMKMDDLRTRLATCQQGYSQQIKAAKQDWYRLLAEFRAAP